MVELKQKSKHQLLGEILICRHVITSQQLEVALALQKVREGFLGERLVELGYAREEEVVMALVIQCHLPYIAVDQYEINEEILELIPADMARGYHVIPLDRVGDVLTVVMENPLNGFQKEELKRITHCQIAPFISTKMSIEKAMHRWYGDAVSQGEENRYGDI